MWLCTRGVGAKFGNAEGRINGLQDASVRHVPILHKGRSAAKWMAEQESFVKAEETKIKKSANARGAHGLGTVGLVPFGGKTRSKYSAAKPTQCQTPKHKMLACTMVKNDLPYLFEWVEYYRLMGPVTHFVVFDDLSDDNVSLLQAFYQSRGVNLTVVPSIGSSLEGQKKLD